MTIQCILGGGNMTDTFPAPSGVSYSLVNGIASIAPEDVRIALSRGYTVAFGENWPGAELVRMKVPVGAAWPSSGSITTPDGASITVTAGVAKLPIQFVQWAIGFGWSRA